MGTVSFTPVEPSLDTAFERETLAMNYDQYLGWDHEGVLSEWVEGHVITHDLPKVCHQGVVVFLATLLQAFTRLNRLGKVLVSPFIMRMSDQGNARMPDILFLANEHLSRLTHSELQGPADLVIEVISDHSVARDRDIKFSEYQAGGVREYWIIDPRINHLCADFYVRDASGFYRQGSVTPDGIYRSTVLPTFWFRVNWLWKDDLNPLAVLAEIVGQETLMAALVEEC